MRWMYSQAQAIQPPPLLVGVIGDGGAVIAARCETDQKLSVARVRTRLVGASGEMRDGRETEVARSALNHFGLGYQGD